MRAKPNCARVRVVRVTLPRYEIQYATVELSLEQAQTIADKKLLSVETHLVEPVGQEVVFDFRVDDVALSATLLFRIIQTTDAMTILEWWPRRKTDPDLLDLWIDGLRRQQSGEANSDSAAEQTEQLRLHELCRRALAGNPFVALDVHWSATWQEVEAAFTEATTMLLQLKQSPVLVGKHESHIHKARAGLIAARELLSNLEKRQALRMKFVSREEIQHALGVARHREETACRNGDYEQLTQLRDLIRELLF